MNKNKFKTGDFVLCIVPKSSKSSRFDLDNNIYKVEKAYSDILHLENATYDLGFNINRFVLVSNIDNKLLNLIFG